jgi:hypothetical protein
MKDSLTLFKEATPDHHDWAEQFVESADPRYNHESKKLIFLEDQPMDIVDEEGFHPQPKHYTLRRKVGEFWAAKRSPDLAEVIAFGQSITAYLTPEQFQSAQFLSLADEILTVEIPGIGRRQWSAPTPSKQRDNTTRSAR